MEIIVVSGRSGSGKSIVLHLLEDLEYYCIDNIPLGLVVDCIKKTANMQDKIALSIDARNLSFDLNDFESIKNEIQKLGVNLQIVYLDADDRTLLKRFSETRRKHPLTKKDVSLAEALNIERELLKNIANSADLSIDTTDLNINELRNFICDLIKNKGPGLTLLFQSFAYKYGVPMNTDFVFDTRCLPNPYWDKYLRHFNGKEKEIIDFLNAVPQVNNMFIMIRDFIATWLPAFIHENRKYLTISIGCTGGQHRSVYLVDALARQFKSPSLNVIIRHRELL